MSSLRKRIRTAVFAAAAAVAVVLAAASGGMAAEASGTTGTTGTQGASGTTGTAAAPQVSVTTPRNQVLTYEYQKEQEFVLCITNKGSTDITNFKIGPDLKWEDYSKWPFKTDYQKYSASVKELKAGKSELVSFAFTERDDVPSSRYLLQFSYKYTANDGSKVTGETSFYVNTTSKADQDSGKADDGENEEGGGSGGSKAGAGGYSSGGASYSGSDGEEGGGGSGSVPRVIITGFTTKPKLVQAGSNFTLTVHLKNTSKKSKVQNLLFDFNSPEEGADEQSIAPAFLPSSGSGSVYLEQIKAGGTADISIKLNAKSDLLQKPYSIQVGMKYEDASYNAVEASSSVSIPVKQDARFEFSDVEINPESIAVDDEANVMCDLYNLGRIKLYNVKATFEGSCIEKEEVFIGNVESGATASIDAMLKGVQATEGPAVVTMTMSYENEDGEEATEEKELMLEVSEGGEEDMIEEMSGPVEETGGLPVFPIIIGVVIVLAVLIAVIVFRKRRKKAKARRIRMEEEDFLYELDGSSEDEL